MITDTIKLLCEKSGMTQAELACKLGATRLGGWTYRQRDIINHRNRKLT